MSDGCRMNADNGIILVSGGKRYGAALTFVGAMCIRIDELLSGAHGWQKCVESMFQCTLSTTYKII